jgi:hypothetical protein
LKVSRKAGDTGTGRYIPLLRFVRPSKTTTPAFRSIRSP